MNYFIGPMPGFEDSNLYSEQPIVAILETEGAKEQLKDGSILTRGGNFKVACFETISEATAFRKKHENPDRAPATVKIYAFANGEWKLVKMVAESNKETS